MKKRNPLVGYGRISMQIFESFGIKISRFAVGRLLRKYHQRLPPSGGPSWLTFIGHLKDSLWSVDLFRCESIFLKTHWVMVVIDQFSRRIIGFAVHIGDPDGKAYCVMFNSIISGKPPPKYLSSDNDPLFLFHRWKANLRILEIEEIKSIAGVPQSHPFIERTIKSIRTEFLDHTLFFNSRDLQRKLNSFQKYYNDTRGHSSLEMNTPSQMASNENANKKVAQLESYRWKTHCNGLYQYPVAA
jgi:putative transposase